MKDILEYTSYRQYIADYYAERKAKSAFSWQEFATLAGFSSSIFLKYVSEGRYNLGEATAVRVATAMKLADYECDFFVELVKFDHAKTDAEKDAIKKKRYEEMFPNAEYGKDCFYVGAPYNYIGYFTKPMLREFDMATDTYIPYTFMPEIGNNECWFKNLRKK